MRPDRHLEFMRCADRCKDRSRIAGMKSARNVGRANEFQNILIVAGALTQVRVEVDTRGS